MFQREQHPSVLPRCLPSSFPAVECRLLPACHPQRSLSAGYIKGIKFWWELRKGFSCIPDSLKSWLWRPDSDFKHRPIFSDWHPVLLLYTFLPQEVWVQRPHTKQAHWFNLLIVNSGQLKSGFRRSSQAFFLPEQNRESASTVPPLLRRSIHTSWSWKTSKLNL